MRVRSRRRVLQFAQRSRSDTVYGVMTPAELIRDTRRSKRLSQRRLALRAGTSQSAIARIESGEEEVTWPRLRAIMVSMGEEPLLGEPAAAEPLRRGRPARPASASPSRRLEGGVAFDKFASELRVAARQARSGA